MAVDQERIRAACREVLLAIGEDPDRPGLVDTPARWARWWAEFVEHDAGTMTTFEHVHADQMVVIGGLEVWSLCEHHLLPFRSTVTIGVIASDVVLGLSKYGRIARAAGHRLQLQERMTEDIADAVASAAATPDVAVVTRGVHTCMTMRGARMPAEMVTSVTRGRFRDDSSCRAEFMAIEAGIGRR